MRSPRLARTSLLVLALVAVAPASAGLDEPLTHARAALSLPRTSDGMQGRYDAGRDLEEAVYSLRAPALACRLRAALVLARGLVREAEGYDRPLRRLEDLGRRQALVGVRRLRGCSASGDKIRLRRALGWTGFFLPPLRKAAPERARDERVAAELGRLGRAFPGWAAIWTHNLVSGRTAGWNSDAQFPAASTVKLGLLLAAFRRSPPLRSSLDYDLRTMTEWSSNLAANRLLTRVGGPSAVEAALRGVGATRSTFPQGFRVGTAVRRLDVEKPPPHVSGRVTTAHDLGRILYAIHAGAFGNAHALRLSRLNRARSTYALSLLLASKPTGNNVGLLVPWLRRGTPIAQKNGWLHDARHTAAVVYFRSGPKIVVVLTYAPGLKLATARDLGRRVLAALR